MSKNERRGAVFVAVVAATFLVAGLSIGSCATKRSDAELRAEAIKELRGGQAPGIDQETVSTGDGRGFIPSDQWVKCIPTGTVCYEAYDSAANMRYWIFRWPENGGYSVVPRLMNDGGEIRPYTPGYERQLAGDEEADAAVVTEGTVGVDE